MLHVNMERADVKFPLLCLDRSMPTQATHVVGFLSARDPTIIIINSHSVSANLLLAFLSSKSLKINLQCSSKPANDKTSLKTSSFNQQQILAYVSHSTI